MSSTSINQTTGLVPGDASARGVAKAAAVACHHCGLDCREMVLRHGDKDFCCRGCLTVFELLVENGLTDFYQLGRSAGMAFQRPDTSEQFGYLDDPALRSRLVQFDSDKLTRITLRVPAIHCVACIWLLENLPRLNPAINEARVNFPRKEVALSFDPRRLKLSEAVALLTSLGYQPELRFDDLDRVTASPISRRLWLQLGIAGFAFGNIMLFSLPSYFGLDSFSEPAFARIFGWFSFALALPVFLVSAADYWRSAWTGLRQRQLTIEVPIALGLIAIMVRSLYEIGTGVGEGYFDSLTGLLFFLLIGRVFQQKTYNRLSFDRDYKSFFPLAVTRLRRKEMEFWNNGVMGSDARPDHPTTPPLHHSSREERVSLAQLAVGDRLIIRNGELIPADAKLCSGPALIDYSFVTGESDPQAVESGAHLFAGGRQMGGAIEVEMTRPVNQSYLTALWNQPAFQKDSSSTLDTIINRFSRRFTLNVVGIAVAAGIWWTAAGDTDRAAKAFVSVLIVACPCALALATPFTLGTALRMLGRRRVFLKTGTVIESMARVETIVFDKTGTLTATGSGAVRFIGRPLSETEERWLYSLTRHSTHPYAVRIGEAIARDHFPETVRTFLETPGKGMEARVDGHEIWIGAASWLASRGAEQSGHSISEPSSLSTVEPLNDATQTTGSEVHVAIDGRYRGKFVLGGALRPAAGRMIQNLDAGHELALLSGDNATERENFSQLLGQRSALHFNQSPLNKLEFIHGLQRGGRKVMMVGDGLNDAGALKQSDVGLAVVEEVGAFSPASDGIIAADTVPQLDRLLSYARAIVRVVKGGLAISAAYNLVGLGLAVQGLLSPVFCAVFMPLSSITVVAFSSGMATWLGRRMMPLKTEDQP